MRRNAGSRRNGAATSRYAVARRRSRGPDKRPGHVRASREELEAFIGRLPRGSRPRISWMPLKRTSHGSIAELRPRAIDLLEQEQRLREHAASTSSRGSCSSALYQ